MLSWNKAVIIQSVWYVWYCLMQVKLNDHPGTVRKICLNSILSGCFPEECSDFRSSLWSLDLAWSFVLNRCPDVCIYPESRLNLPRFMCKDVNILGASSSLHLQILTDRSQSLPHLEHEAIRLEYDERLTIQLQNCLESCEINLNHTWSICSLTPWYQQTNMQMCHLEAVPRYHYHASLSFFINASVFPRGCFGCLSPEMPWTGQALGHQATKTKKLMSFTKNQNQNLSICKSLSCPWPRSRPFSFPFWPLMSTEKYCTYHHAT